MYQAAVHWFFIMFTIRYVVVFCMLLLALRSEALGILPFTTTAGAGIERIMQTTVDSAGNVYALLFFNQNFTIDSAGTAITITVAPNATPQALNKFKNSIVLIKWNKSGIYQYHLPYWLYYSNFNVAAPWEFFRDFRYSITALNGGVFVSIPTFYADSTVFINKTKTVYKTLLGPDQHNARRFVTHNFLGKINQAGYYEWDARISTSGKEYVIANNLFSNPNVFSNFSFNINNGNVQVLSNVSNINDTTVIDTLFITDAINNRYKFAYSHDTTNIPSRQLFTFTPIGVYIGGAYASNISKRKLLTSKGQLNTSPRQITSASDGDNLYFIQYNERSESDTFLTTSQVVIPPNSLVLYKLNSGGELQWGRVLATGLINNAHIVFQKNTGKLIIGISYFGFAANIVDAPLAEIQGEEEVFIGQYSKSGTLLNYTSFGGSKPDIINSIAANNLKNNSIVLLGTTFSNQMAIGSGSCNILNPNNRAIVFAVTLDSMLQCKHTATLRGDSIKFSLYSSIGQDVVGKNNSVFIGGWYRGSINFGCKQYNSPSSENAFIIEYGFDADTVDTIVCYTMPSPSGKYVWDSTGTYVDTVKTAQLCDSIIWFRVKINNTKSQLDSSVCKSLRSYSGRYVWDSSGTYRDTIPNAVGCDSLITLRLVVKNSKSQIDTTVKHIYIRPTIKDTLRISGIYYDTIPNAAGCDSTLKINLKVLQTNSTIDTAVCRMFKLPGSMRQYDSTGIYQDTLPNTLGGDSVITIRLQVLNSKSVLDTSLCKPLQSPSGKYWLSNDTLLVDTIPNYRGCDSIINIQYTRAKLSSIIDTTNCNAVLSPSGNFLLEQTGIYTDTLPTLQGCDSIITIRYNRSGASSTVQCNFCDTFISPSGKYTYRSSGNYTDTLITSHGCDSIIFLQLTYIPLTVSVSASNTITCQTPQANLLAASNGSQFSWHPGKFLSDSLVANPIVFTPTTQLYTVKVNDTLGCEKSDTITAIADKTEEINKLPNVFTPNNDGQNDCVSLANAARFLTVTYAIFNRWGNKVYETSDGAACWDGKNAQGNDLSEGVYFFRLTGISICNTPIEETGTIQLIR
jgi:gliding motility-associated-like protein